MKLLLRKPSEWLMITAGALILISVPLIAESGTFTLWFGAKIIYGTGVIAMIVER